MKLLLIILFFIPFIATAQISDSVNIKYLLAQVNIIKSLITTNKQEFNAYKIVTDKRIKVLEDSMSKIRPLIFHVDDFIFNKGTYSDTVKIKKPQ